MIQLVNVGNFESFVKHNLRLREDKEERQSENMIFSSKLPFERQFYGFMSKEGAWQSVEETEGEA